MADCNTNPDGCYTCLSDRQLFALIAEYLCDIKGGGIPIGGVVSVSNFPAVQDVNVLSSIVLDVSGSSVSVSNFPAVQPVSGTVTALQGTIPWTVDGTIAATQSGVWTTGRTWDLAFASDQVDVSGSVIALDAATLAALETITVLQGTIPWTVDGTVTVNQGTSPWVVSVSNFPATVAVTQSGVWSVGRTWDLDFLTDQVDASGSVVALDAATLAALETITVLQGTSPWVVSGTFTPSGTQDVNIVSSITVTVQATNLDIRDLSFATDKVDVSGSSVSVTNFPASFSVTQGTSPWVVSLTSTTITGTVAVTQSGVWSVGRTWDLGFATDQVDASGSVVALDAATLLALETVTVLQGTSPWVVSGTFTPSGTQDVNIVSSITLTVQATDLDIRNLVFSTDKVDASGSNISVSNFPASQVVTATDLDIRNLTFATDKVDASGSVVALDAATLLALETITVLQGTSPWVVSGTVTATPTGTQDVNVVSSITLTVAATDLDIRDLTFAADKVDASGSSVSVSNFPATQPVSGSLGRTWDLSFAADQADVSGSSVSVSNFPATQPVSGTVTANQGTSPWVVSLTSTTITGTVAVTGPLTDAELRATPVPVNGTVTVNQGTSPWVVTGGTQYAEDTAHVTGDLVNMAGVVQQAADTALSGDGDRSLLQVDASGFLKVNIKAGAGSGGVAQTDKSGFTEGATSFTPVGGVFNETISADPTEDQAAAARITAKRAVHVNLRNNAGVEIGTATDPVRTDPTGTTIQPVNGTVTANQGTSPWVTSLTSTTITGTVAVTQSGAWTTGRTWDLSFAADQADVSGSVVALDAATLLALETITALQGTSPWVVSGTVTATPTGTQDVNIVSSITLNVAATNLDIRDLAFATDTVDVSGSSVSVSNFPATVAVTQSTSPWVTNDPGLPNALGQAAMAGSTSVVIASDQSSLPVTVGNFPVTQPVSGTVSATQGTSPWVTNDPGLPNALGQALMAGSTSVTIASDQSAVPVSGTVTANQGTSPWVTSLASTTITGTVAVTQSGAWTTGRTWDLSFAADQVDASGSVVALDATTLAALETITVLQGTSPWVVSGTVTATPTGTQDVNIVSSITLNVAATNLDIRDLAFATDTVDVSGSSVSVSNFPATVAVTQSTSPWVTNDPGLPNALGQAAMAGSTSVTIASDQTAIPISGTITATPSGTQDVNVISSITLTVQATNLDIRDLTFAADKVDASGSSVSVSNFPGTQPVSGTVAVTQSTSPWVTNDPGLPNALGQSNMAGSTSITIASDQTAIPISGSITADIQGDYTDDAAFTVAVDKGLAIGGVFTTDSVDAGDFGAFKMNAKRELFIVQDVAANLNMTATLTAETTKVIGTVNQGTSPWVTSLASTTITGTVAVTQSTSPWVVSGAVTTSGTVTEANSAAIKTSVELIDDAIYTDGTGTPSKAIAIAGTDGTNPQIIKTDAAGELQIDVLTMPAVTQGTSPWVTSLASTTITGSVAVTGTFWQATQPVSGTVTANQGTSPWVTSLASTTITGTVAISAAALPLPSGAATSALQTQPGVDIGDVTVNNGAAGAAVNVQDGGNSLTVDGTVNVVIPPLPTIVATQVSVGTVQVAVPTSNLASRQTITFKALGANGDKIYIGLTGVTALTGFELDAGSSVDIDADSTVNFFAISASGTQKVSTIEIA